MKKLQPHIKVSRDMHYFLKINAAFKRKSISALVNDIFKEYYEKEKEAFDNNIFKKKDIGDENEINGNEIQF
jgi:hypothetical protein